MDEILTILEAVEKFDSGNRQASAVGQLVHGLNLSIFTTVLSVLQCKTFTDGFLKARWVFVKRIEDISLSQNQHRALSELRERLFAEFDIEDLILYGSIVWGEADEESDIDVLVVTPRPLTRSALRVWRAHRERPRLDPHHLHRCAAG